jgi:S-DNA-T family DNA segregation ATPase FtsK/SpoIIIE
MKRTNNYRSSSHGVIIGKTDTGERLQISLGHTLIVGATGSGKGSVLWAYLIGAHYYLGAKQQRLFLLGYDPKRSELAQAEGKRFFRVVFETDDALELIRRLVRKMRQRQQSGTRTFRPTDQEPFIFLVIDEFNSLTTAGDAAWRKEVKANMMALLSQGRSAGIYIVAAAQQPQKDAIGDYRQHFMNRICLRVENAVEVDMVLGAGAVEQGAEAHLIRPATESNGYSTAGIGFTRTDAEPRPVRFRAPRITEEDIALWCAGGEL